MTDEEIERIFANSVNVQKTADRLYQLTGRRFIVEEVGKNDGDGFTAGAYGPGDGDEEEDVESEVESETPAERRARERRDRKLIENARESGRLASTKRDLTMIDPDVLISQLSKAGLGFAMVKRFVEKTDGDELTEQQVTALLMGTWGAEFGKRFQAQDEEGRIARAAVMKARNAQWFAPTAVETGERALASAVHPGAGEKDPLRERIIADKRTAAPWMTEEALERYAAEMARELDRAGRAKAKPGTMERV
jgi:hypothetical protein